MRRILHAALRILCVVLLAAAWPAHAYAQDGGCEAGEKEVHSLEFRGNTAFSSSDLELRIWTESSSWMRRHFGHFGTKRCFNSDSVATDVRRLKKLYRDKGYYRAIVDTLVSRTGADAVRLVFVIHEGEPIRIDSLTIAGLDSVRNSAAILRDLGMRVGGTFDLSLLAADLDTIVIRLRNSGYPRADVVKNYTVLEDSLRARVGITVLPGQLARIGEIHVRVTPLDGGPQQISDDVVRGLLGIRSHDLYSDNGLVAAQRSLYQLGTYRHVEVAPLPDSLQPKGDSLVSLLVDLREDYTRQLDTHSGWATLDCFHTRASYTFLNFLDRAQRLELTGQLSKVGYGAPLASSATRPFCYQDVLRKDPFSDTTNYSIAATWRRPGSFGGGWVPSLSLYRERRSEYQAYLRSTLIGGEAAATKYVSENGTVRAAYNLEYGRTSAQPALLCAVFNRCDQAERNQIQGLGRLAVASAQYSLVRTDNVFSPSRGFAIRGELRSSLDALGSSPDLTFNKGTIDGAWYTPVGRSTVLAIRLRGGLVVDGGFSFSNPTRFIPPTERLYAGGANSVRGFQQNQLGALLYIAQGYDTVKVNDSTRYFRSPDGVTPFRVVPVGGNAMFVSNLEYRLADVFFPQLLQYTVFLDGGDVWTRSTPGTGFGWSKMSWTPGIGVRVFTPVGPLQMNVGYNPYRQPNGAIYYDAKVDPETGVAPLFCVSPNNTIPVHVRGGTYTQDEVACPSVFSPSQPSSFFRRLTFTFSVGPEF